VTFVLDNSVAMRWCFESKRSPDNRSDMRDDPICLTDPAFSFAQGHLLIETK